MNRKSFSVIVAIISMSLFSGCAVFMAHPKVTMYRDPFPAKADDEELVIFDSKAPDHDYVEIARISCGDTSDSWNMEQISKKAREIGADGLIILGKTGSYGAAVPVGGAYIASDSGYGIEAIAIKFK